MLMDYVFIVCDIDFCGYVYLRKNQKKISVTGLVFWDKLHR